MCGICGTNGFFRNNGKIFKYLLRENVIRGRHATGMVWKEKDTTEFKFAKSPLESPDFLKTKMRIPNYCTSNILIGHARNSTSGNPKDNTENHPHIYGDWVVVHNGVIDKVDELYKECGIEKKVLCDSAVIPVVFEKFGFEKGLEMLPGWFSIIAVNIKTPERIYIAKNWAAYAPICIGRINENSIIFSSIEDDVKLFTKNTFMLAPNSWKIYEYGIQIERGNFIPKKSVSVENILTAGDIKSKTMDPAIRHYLDWQRVYDSRIEYGD